MEDFLIEEVNKLIKEYFKTGDPLVMSELKQLLDHVEKNRWRFLKI